MECRISTHHHWWSQNVGWTVAGTVTLRGGKKYILTPERMSGLKPSGVEKKINQQAKLDGNGNKTLQH